jgi:hypothetical protein
VQIKLVVPTHAAIKIAVDHNAEILTVVNIIRVLLNVDAKRRTIAVAVVQTKLPARQIKIAFLVLVSFLVGVYPVDLLCLLKIAPHQSGLL